MPMLQTIFRVGDEVASAVADGVPVVAMESTIYSAFGLPEPANLEPSERRYSERKRAASLFPPREI